MAENIEDTSAGQNKAGNADGASDQRLEQLNAQLKTMNEQFTQALSNIQSKLITKEPEVIEPTPETFLDIKPQEFERKIEQKVEQRMAERERQASRKSQALAALAAEYPEATDVSHSMHKKVLEIHSTLKAELQDTAEGYELAVSKAAMQLGIAPKSARREINNDSFSMSGRSSSQAPKTKKVELTREMLDTAALMGLDISNPKQLERLQSRAQRQKWGKYE